MKRRTGLSGHVFDPAGQPVEGAVVKARGQGAGSDSHVTATTDADGTFSMKVQSDMAYVLMFSTAIWWDITVGSC